MVPSLSDFALQEKDVLQALNKAVARDVDYADMYVESCVTDSVSMEESLVKRAVKSVTQGAGVRAVAGERTGFAYSDDLSVRDLEIAADTREELDQYTPNNPVYLVFSRSNAFINSKAIEAIGPDRIVLSTDYGWNSELPRPAAGLLAERPSPPCSGQACCGAAQGPTRARRRAPRGRCSRTRSGAPARPSGTRSPPSGAPRARAWRTPARKGAFPGRARGPVS